MKGETSGAQYYEGITVRSTPASVNYSSQTTVLTNTTPTMIATINATPAKVVPPVQQRTIKNISPVPDSTALDCPASVILQKIPTPASPILKAQLSAPPKTPNSNNNNTPVEQSQNNPVTKVDSKSQVGPRVLKVLCTRQFVHDLGYNYFGCFIRTLS